MPYQRNLNPGELEQLFNQALRQLAEAITEYKEARLKNAAHEPNAELASQRLAVAHECVVTCLDTYHARRQALEVARVQPGN